MQVIFGFLFGILYFALLLYFFSMWARFVVDLLRTFQRNWRPVGFSLVMIELVFTVTDPPIKFFRRLFPPLRIGPVALDFGWTLTMLCVIVSMWIVSFLQITVG